MSATYLVTTPNPKFGGKTAGIQFHEGKAVVNVAVLDARLYPNRKTAVQDAITRLQKDFGYTAKCIDGRADKAEAAAT